MTINSRIHRPTADFLQRRGASRPNQESALCIAAIVAAWLDHLCNDTGLYPFEGARDPVLAATEEPFASSYRLRQHGTSASRYTAEGWALAASAIKRLYEFCRDVYGHIPPVQIASFRHQEGWSGTKIVGCCVEEPP